MKPKEILFNIPSDFHSDTIEAKTPLRNDAFALSDEEKMEKIQHHFKEIMNTLGLDLADDSLKGTPNRVAKMFIKEVFSGLNPQNKPTPKLFENKYGYDNMLVEKDITFYSYCEHHFVPFFGKAHIAYFSTGHVIGISKINRIVQYFAKRPQIQERLTVQIANELKAVLKTKDVAVVMEAFHLCVASRGVGDTNSQTHTSQFKGKFKIQEIKTEFLNAIQLPENKIE